MQLSGFNAEQILQRQALSLCEQANPSINQIVLLGFQSNLRGLFIQN